MYKNTLKIILLVAFIININGCSSRDTVETVTFIEYKKIEQLRGQPPKIYVRASDSYVYIFSHSNYYIRNDTLFGKDNSGREIVLTNIKSITYYNYVIEQDVEVHFDPEKDSIISYKNAGAKAYIEMNEGTDYTGELLVVRDSIMIVCEEYDADEQELADSVYALFKLNNRDIKLIELSVGNYSRTGAGIGFLAGALAGGVTASSSSDPYVVLKTWGGAAIGGFAGAIIGGAIGFFFTNYEDVYEQANPEEYDFKKLNIYARYVNNEPDFLNKIK
jgi:hypothetical protein